MFQWNLDHIIIPIENLWNIKHSVWLQLNFMMFDTRFLFLGELWFHKGCHLCKIVNLVHHANVRELDWKMVCNDVLSFHQLSDHFLNLWYLRTSSNRKCYELWLSGVSEHKFCLWLLITQDAGWRDQCVKYSLAFIRNKNRSKSYFLHHTLWCEGFDMEWVSFDLIQVDLVQGGNACVLHKWLVDHTKVS